MSCGSSAVCETVFLCCVTVSASLSRAVVCVYVGLFLGSALLHRSTCLFLTTTTVLMTVARRSARVRECQSSDFALLFLYWARGSGHLLPHVNYRISLTACSEYPLLGYRWGCVESAHRVGKLTSELRGVYLRTWLCVGLVL